LTSHFGKSGAKLRKKVVKNNGFWKFFAAKRPFRPSERNLAYNKGRSATIGDVCYHRDARRMLSTLSVGNMVEESQSLHNRILLEHVPSGGEMLQQVIKAIKN